MVQFRQGVTLGAYLSTLHQRSLKKLCLNYSNFGRAERISIKNTSNSNPFPEKQLAVLYWQRIIRPLAVFQIPPAFSLSCNRGKP